VKFGSANGWLTLAYELAGSSDQQIARTSLAN
jgi:hypothetical protein